MRLNSARPRRSLPTGRKRATKSCCRSLIARPRRAGESGGPSRPDTTSSALTPPHATIAPAAPGDQPDRWCAPKRLQSDGRAHRQVQTGRTRWPRAAPPGTYEANTPKKEHHEEPDIPRHLEKDRPPAAPAGSPVPGWLPLLTPLTGACRGLRRSTDTRGLATGCRVFLFPPLTPWRRESTTKLASA
jgi:hypothetical protein